LSFILSYTKHVFDLITFRCYPMYYLSCW